MHLCTEVWILLFRFFLSETRTQTAGENNQRIAMGLPDGPWPEKFPSWYKNSRLNKDCKVFFGWEELYQNYFLKVHQIFKFCNIMLRKISSSVSKEVYCPVISAHFCSHVAVNGSENEERVHRNLEFTRLIISNKRRN